MTLRNIIFSAIGVLFFILIISFVGCERIDQGNKGLRVDQTGSAKGEPEVQDASGWQFYIRGMTRVFEYPTYQQHKEYEALEIPAKGGTIFTIHPAFNYSINSSKLKELFIQYRQDLPTLEEGFVKNAMFNALREATNRFTVDSLLNNVSSYDAEVQKELQTKLQPYFIVTQFTSRLTPDKELAGIIQQKAKTLQEAIKVENEQRKIKAQAENDIISARRDSAVKVMAALAEARSIMVKQEALQKSPQYVELIKAERWNGVLPQYMLGNGTGLFLNMNK